MFYIPGGSSGCLPLTVCQNTWCQLSQGTWFAKGPTSQRAHPGNQTLAKKVSMGKSELERPLLYLVFCHLLEEKKLHSSTIINQEINAKIEHSPIKWTGPISLSGASRHHHQAHTLIGHPELPHEEVVEFKGTLLRHIPHNFGTS